ncbi:IMMP2L [Scenedesmus sp. PABB004]|nr:IMMP2L [Scenedesmus sp. PABB004]
MAGARLRQGLWLLPPVVAFTDLVAAVIRVDGASMRPTLNPDAGGGSDYVLVEKASVKLLRRYARGEVVVLWAPDDPHQQIIKRLLALEGDTIVDDTRAGTWTEVPRGRCWVEGDNPAMSSDSKSAYGPVHLGLLEGRVTHVVWPPERMGRVAARPQPERLLSTDRRPAG